MRRVVAGLLIVCMILFGVQLPAQADSDDGVITRYDLTAAAVKDGTTTVKIDFDIDFGTSDQHGPYVTLPKRQAIPGDADHWRAFDISDITAASPTGAPANVDTETNGGALAIKIGDEDREISGKQSYQVGYTIRGLVNPRAGGGLDEINWNVIGTQWEIPLRDVTVKLTGPSTVTRAACFTGSVGSSTPCQSSRPEQDTVTFSQPEVQPGDGLTVVGGWSAGTFVGAEPRLETRYHVGNTFTANGGTIGGSVALLVLGSLVLALRARRRGRDSQYAGIAPGSTPSGDPDQTEVTAAGRGPVAVQFTPPRGVEPGPMSTLMDRNARPRAVTATVVDLAVRGFLRIEEVPTAETDGKKPDWRLWRTDREADTLRPYEHDLLKSVFPDQSQDPVWLSTAKNLTGTISTTQKALYAEVTERGWFAEQPDRARQRAGVVAMLIFMAGIGATIGLAFVGWALVGVALVLVGVMAMVMAYRVPPRTAAGTAVWHQARGFELYLKTAEADQIRFEEGIDVFSRYLPYAIAFGVAERWTKVFGELAEQGRYQVEPTWYVGGQLAGMHGFAAGGFGESLTAFSSAATSAMTAASAGSGGGSGFGGGVGGGVGGGGGGSW